MRIFFLDQSSKLGGAELCLADIAAYLQANCYSVSTDRAVSFVEHEQDQSLVGVFTDGDFPHYLRQRNIPVTVLAGQEICVQKQSGFWAGIKNLNRLIPLIVKVVHLSQNYDLIYANTQKALVVGAIASMFSRRPLVYHLHDIVSPEHFSRINRRLIVTFANQAVLVIANSASSRNALIAAGGKSDRIHTVYNGFNPDLYSKTLPLPHPIRQTLHCDHHFVVGHFSRLSSWKGQHILLEALPHCPDNVIAWLVGDALFGEDEYVNQLHQIIDRLNLHHRVHFLGFRSDVPTLMQACNLIVHTSTAPEPFGRVIIEAMLSRRPVIAADAGGAVELIEHDRTGWLCPPGQPRLLAEQMTECYYRPEKCTQIVAESYQQALERFSLLHTNKAIASLLQSFVYTASR